jgi:hypothetical protein
MVKPFRMINLWDNFRCSSSHEIGRGGYQPPRGLYLELEKERCGLEGSPPSDNVMFDNQCYATTPSSSNGNSDQDQPGSYGTAGRRHHSHSHQPQPNVTPTPGSPTSRLLLEYEMHLRNTLAKGMDAESYSLHTFEALLSQSMENLGNFKAPRPSMCVNWCFCSLSFHSLARSSYYHHQHCLALSKFFTINSFPPS